MTYLLKNSPDKVFDMANEVQQKSLYRKHGQVETREGNMTTGYHHILDNLSNVLDNAMKTAGIRPSKLDTAITSLRRARSAIPPNHANRYLRGNIMDNTWHIHVDKGRNRNGTQKNSLQRWWDGD